MESYIKLTCTLLFSLFILSFVHAQSGSVKGSVVDDYGPLPSASIKLLKVGNTEQIQGVVSDMDGNFELSADLEMDLVLEISFMGYEIMRSESFRLTPEENEIDLGVIKMLMEAQVLESVLLQTKKRPITFSNASTIVQIENNPMAIGETAYSILQHLPGVSISHTGEIQMHGKSGVQVIINGRKTYMTGEELQSYLASIPSDAIANIELNTQPTASYDADGDAGILKIELKRATEDHFSGSFNAGYTNKQLNLWNANIFLSDQREKWSWSFLLDASRKGYVRDQYLNTDFSSHSSLDWLKQEGEEVATTQPFFSQLDMRYDLSENQSIGGHIQIGTKKMYRDWNSNSILKSMDTNVLEHIASFNHHTDKFNHGILHAFYKIKTDSLGSNLNMSVDASNVKRDIISDFNNEYSKENSETRLELLESPSSNIYQIFTAKADYEKLWENGRNLKFGSKISQVNFQSEVDFYSIEDQTPIYDNERSSVFNYKERIWAVYMDFYTPLHPKWDLNIGLRMEKTWGEGHEKLADDKHDRNYLDWFPSLSLKQKVSKNYQINYGYSKRITRPAFDWMNPQIFYIDPYNYTKGNPYLKPQHKQSVTMNHLIKNNYRIGLSYEYTSDYMVEVPMTGTNSNQTNFSTQNLSNAISYGVNIYAPLRIANFWNTDNSLTINQLTYELELEDISRRKHKDLYVLFQNQHQIELPKGLNLNLNFTVQSPFSYGYYKVNGQWWTDISLQKSFASKWDLSLKFTDVFKTMNMNVDYQFNDNSSNIKQYMGNRSISMQLSYRFGSKKKSKMENANEMDEYDRIQQN